MEAQERAVVVLNKDYKRFSEAVDGQHGGGHEVAATAKAVAAAPTAEAGTFAWGINEETLEAFP